MYKNKFPFALKCLLSISVFLIAPALLHSQEEPGNISEQRAKWFFIPRSYPHDSIPSDAMRNAFSQMQQLINQNGYTLQGPAMWTSNGPTPFNTDNQCFNFYNCSGRVNACKFDPTDATGQRFFIGGANGGVWKTTDAGHNWTPMSDFLPSLASGALAIDPGNPDIIYYGTGDESYYCFSYIYWGQGLFKSTDGGTTWNNGITITGFPDRQICSRIAIRPGYNEQLLAALSSGLYRSSDAGLSWYRLLSGLCTDVVFSGDGNKAYAVGYIPACGGVGYQVSTDGGVTFARIDNEFTPIGVSRVAVCRDYSDIVYVSTVFWVQECNYTTGAFYIWKSTNGGINFNTPPAYITAACQVNADNFLYVSPTEPNTCYAGEIDLQKTTNGGNNWSTIAGYPTSVHPDFHSMDINPLDPEKILVGHDGGISLSTNGGANWLDYTNNNLTLAQNFRVTSSPFNPDVVIAGFEDEGLGYKSGTNMWFSTHGHGYPRRAPWTAAMLFILPCCPT